MILLFSERKAREGDEGGQVGDATRFEALINSLKAGAKPLARQMYPR
jgi:hypothetical protein